MQVCQNISVEVPRPATPAIARRDTVQFRLSGYMPQLKEDNKEKYAEKNLAMLVTRFGEEFRQRFKLDTNWGLIDPLLAYAVLPSTCATFRAMVIADGDGDGGEMRLVNGVNLARLFKIVCTRKLKGLPLLTKDRVSPAKAYRCKYRPVLVVVQMHRIRLHDPHLREALTRLESTGHLVIACAGIYDDHAISVVDYLATVFEEVRITTSVAAPGVAYVVGKTYERATDDRDLPEPEVDTYPRPVWFDDLARFNQALVVPNPTDKDRASWFESLRL
jgi:hypothetical protein